jgi:hypothetical protein
MQAAHRVAPWNFRVIEIVAACFWAFIRQPSRPTLRVFAIVAKGAAILIARFVMHGCDVVTEYDRTHTTNTTPLSADECEIIEAEVTRGRLLEKET